MVDLILEIKENKKVKDCSVEAYQLFGKGGYSVEQFAAWEVEGVKVRVENLLGYGNTPVLTDVNNKTYVTVRVDDEYAEVIEQMVESNTAKFIRRVVRREDDTPFMVRVDDGEGGTRMQEMSKIA